MAIHGPYNDAVYAIFARRYDTEREAKENIVYTHACARTHAHIDISVVV
jgi:hypothetical protein